jgi:hypothetical protein
MKPAIEPVIRMRPGQQRIDRSSAGRAEIRRHVAGREDVGQEQDLLVAQAVRHLERPDISEGNAQILRLAARSPQEMVKGTTTLSPTLSFLFPHRLRPLHAGDHAVEDVQVGAADGTGRDLD